jgi:hypothetical protein
MDPVLESVRKEWKKYLPSACMPEQMCVFCQRGDREQKSLKARLILKDDFDWTLDDGPNRLRYVAGTGTLLASPPPPVTRTCT